MKVYANHQYVDISSVKVFYWNRIKFCIHRSVDNPHLWTVSEFTTGLQVANNEKTINSAESLAKYRLGMVDKEQINKVIRYQISKRGVINHETTQA